MLLLVVSNLLQIVALKLYHLKKKLPIISSVQISGGSRISRRGDVDLVGGWAPEMVAFRKILYVETKESGPLGGRAPGKPPRSANANHGV